MTNGKAAVRRTKREEDLLVGMIKDNKGSGGGDEKPQENVLKQAVHHEWQEQDE